MRRSVLTLLETPLGSNSILDSLAAHFHLDFTCCGSDVRVVLSFGDLAPDDQQLTLEAVADEVRHNSRFRAGWQQAGRSELLPAESNCWAPRGKHPNTS